MAKGKPIELMHYYYGVSPGFKMCSECCNFVSYSAGGKKIKKCMAYGVTCSNRSDWAKKWTACGLFGKKIDHQIISDSAKRMFSRIGLQNKQDISEEGSQGVLSLWEE